MLSDESGDPYSIKNKHLLNGNAKNPGNIVSQFQRRIVFVLFQEDYGFPSYIHFFSQIILGKVKFSPEFLNPVNHGVFP